MVAIPIRKALTMVSKTHRKKQFPTNITVVSTRAVTSDDMNKGHRALTTPNTSDETASRSKPTKLESPKQPYDFNVPTKVQRKPSHKSRDFLDVPYTCFPALFVPSTVAVMKDQDDVASEISFELIPDRVPTPRPKMERKTLKTLNCHTPDVETEPNDWPSDEEDSVVGSPFGKEGRHRSFQSRLEDSMCGAWPCSPEKISQHDEHQERLSMMPCANPMAAARDDKETHWDDLSIPSARDISSGLSSYE